MMDLATILRAYKAVGPIVAQIPAVKHVFDEATTALPLRDQTEARSAYADLIADNDDGHVRLQEKLGKAAKE